MWGEKKPRKVKQKYEGNGFLEVHSGAITLRNEDKKFIETISMDASNFLIALQQNGGRFDTRSFTVQVENIVTGFGKGKFIILKFIVLIFKVENSSRLVQLNDL